MVKFTSSIKDIEEIQLERLKWTFNQALKSRLYRNKLEGIEIRSLRDLSRLPFTTKRDLISSYPYGSLAIDLSEVRLILSSSGTTGTPVLTFYSSRDYELWMERLVRNLKLVGIGKGDVFVNTSNQALFTGRGYTDAALLVGATLIPVGPASPERHLKIMAELGVTSFHAIPSFAVKMANMAKDNNLTNRLKLRKAILGAEMWSEATRRRIEEGLNVVTYDNYGVAELGGPGIAIECHDRDGLHVWADHYIVEVIDPRSGEQLSEGGEGELVITSLTREAMPMIRYRTGDITKLMPSDCSCGLRTPKISRIKGRLDDMVKVRGISLYPKAVEEVVSSIPELTGEYQIVLSGFDDITVRVEVKKCVTNIDHVKTVLRDKIKEATMLNVNIELMEEGKIMYEGKARRVMDLRRL
ncbi:MAG: AMP-binding protein [Candidatus Nezhaarchaeota archaeon]|nr:AMP-binding protein [Candidatus Nezhaarchaeota archaeon]MCX8142406.1 AMP-binding protein [Candidatus Nezhaarchaeota archaeon]MDW8050621.1 AMP-binding protein [Nitrososphaerota archaeon]